MYTDVPRVPYSTKISLVGGFNPSEKYESQLGWWHPIYEMENKSHVWNHQPVERFITAFRYHYYIPLLDDYNYLVGGFNPSEKYESQLGWWHPIIIWNGKNRTCLKPPTRYNLYWLVYSL